MKRVTLLFSVYSAAGFILLSVVYLLLKAIKLAIYGESGLVFGSLFRMFMYHEQHPYQYLLLIAIIYGCIAAPWSYYVGRSLKRWKRAVSIVGVMLLTVLVSSAPGGMLWVLHDAQAGFFPRMSQFWRALWWGAIAGFQLGWLIFLLSTPYNAICLCCGYWLTDYVEKRLRRSVQLS